MNSMIMTSKEKDKLNHYRIKGPLGIEGLQMLAEDVYGESSSDDILNPEI